MSKSGGHSGNIQGPGVTSHSGQQGNFVPKFVFDGKRMRKPVVRRTVDFNSSIIKRLRKYPFTWTPEGRRLITGSSSGEFTLWNGLTFNFETILQAHEQAVRAMTWSRSGNFMISGDNLGAIKYWQPNMNNVQAIQGHTESVRDISFSPSDFKFASCSDDSAIKVWDFVEAREEHLLKGHGWDVKNVQWHPNYSLLASGSKDNTVRLWDPRSSFPNLAIMWNQNGKWLLTCGKDQLIKVYDIRKLQEMQVFKGHKKDVTSLAWHPFNESVFASGGFDGALMFWSVGTENAIGTVENAHEQAIWTVDWHPVGHILTTGSNDHTTKFWTRQRPGEPSMTVIPASEFKYTSQGGTQTET